MGHHKSRNLDAISVVDHIYKRVDFLVLEGEGHHSLGQKDTGFPPLHAVVSAIQQKTQHFSGEDFCVVGSLSPHSVFPKLVPA